MNASASTTTLTSRDGSQLYCYTWPADDIPRATLAICHGVGEHAGRYAHVGQFFLARGYNVFAIDLRGHGRSEGKRGHINNFQDYLDDLEALLTYAHNQNANVPLFLWGHSMGGVIALNYGLNNPQKLKAVVATAPGLRDKINAPAWKITLGKVASGIYPSLAQPTGLDPAGISHDPDQVSAYIADPLVHDLVSARWYTEFISTRDLTLEQAPAMRLPTLIMQGTGDPIVDPIGSKAFYERISHNDKKYIEYPGLYHELHNEIQKQDVLTDMEAWLSEQVGLGD